MPDAVPHPIEKYGRAKLASEEAARSVCDAAGLPLIVIRPRTILGPGRLGIFGILFEWIREGRNVYTIGDGNVRFQFIHAEDLIDAYMLALDRQQTGTYNVGTDRFGTMRQALEGVIRHAGSRSKVVGVPPTLVINALRAADWLKVSPLGPYHYHAYGSEYFFDVSPLLELGWKPRYSNDEMFAETYDWFKAHREELMASQTGSVHRRPVRERILSIVRRFS
jgi:nucleoside-diphosphate-sugar epimerase